MSKTHVCNVSVTNHAIGNEKRLFKSSVSKAAEAIGHCPHQSTITALCEYCQKFYVKQSPKPYTCSYDLDVTDDIEIYSNSVHSLMEHLHILVNKCHSFRRVPSSVMIVIEQKIHL